MQIHMNIRFDLKNHNYISKFCPVLLKANNGFNKHEY